MARKTAEEAGLDEAAARAEQDTKQAALASQGHAADLVAQQRAGGSATVLSNGPIPEVKLGPALGAPPIEGDAVDPNLAGRFLLDPSSTAPVIGDATKRKPYRRAGSERFACGKCGVASSGGKFCQECGGPIVAAAEAPPVEGAKVETARSERFFAVLEQKMVLDKTGGHRTPLRAGKIISDKHYDVAGLIRQGVKLKRVDDPSSASTDEALIATMTTG
jgi:hypothetical protein